VTKRISVNKTPLLHDVILLFDIITCKLDAFVDDETLHPAVHTAAARGCTMMNKYYGLSDDSVMYCIAMCSLFHYLLRYFKPNFICLHSSPSQVQVGLLLRLVGWQNINWQQLTSGFGKEALTIQFIANSCSLALSSVHPQVKGIILKSWIHTAQLKAEHESEKLVGTHELIHGKTREYSHPWIWVTGRHKFARIWVSNMVSQVLGMSTCHSGTFWDNFWNNLCCIR